MPRIYHAYLIAGLILVLAGCSTIDLAYNNATSLAAGEFDDAFDLDRQQSDLLDTRLQQFLDWHRREELIRYQQLLESSASQIADGITADEFLAFSRDVRKAWRRILAQSIDSFADLAVTLSPEQIENYRRYYAEKSEERQEYLEMTPQERTAYTVERNLDRLEDWFGNFDRKLEARVEARLASLPDMRSAWLTYREKRHQAFVDALAAAPETGIDPQRLKQIMLDPSTDYARAFEPARMAYWQAYAAAIEDISGWMSEKHRQKAIDRLQKYARAMARLQDRSQSKKVSSSTEWK